MGPARQFVQARVEARRCGESSESRPRARQLPHAVDPRFRRRDRVDSGRAHRVRADRRCARARDGRARMEPPLPLLSRARARSMSPASPRACSKRATRGRCRSKSSTTAFAPRRPPITAADGHRSLRFLEEQTRALTRGENGRPTSVRPARGARAHRLSVPRIRRRRRHARASSPTGSASSASGWRAGIVRRMSRCIGTARGRSC